MVAAKNKALRIKATLANHQRSNWCYDRNSGLYRLESGVTIYMDRHQWSNLEFRVLPCREDMHKAILEQINRTIWTVASGHQDGAGLQGGPDLTVIKKHLNKAILERSERLKLDADWVVCRLEEEARDRNNSAAVRVRALELLGKHLGIFSSGSLVAKRTTTLFADA